MDLKISIKTINNCSILIKDTSIYEPDVATKGLDWYDSVTADIIQINYSTGSVIDAIITEHTCYNYGVPIVYSPPSDAWFTVSHIIFPTKEFIENDVQKGAPYISLFSYIYCLYDKKPYKYTYDSQAGTGEFEEVEWPEIIGINTKLKECILSEYSKDFVSVCNLRNCYINLCQLIFQNRLKDNQCSGRKRACIENNKSLEDLWYRRDLAWSALNVVKYMVEDNQFAAAELLIELIMNSCNGICTGVNKPGKDCGCT